MSMPKRASPIGPLVPAIIAGQRHTAVQQNRNTLCVAEFLSLSDIQPVTVDGQPRFVEDVTRHQESTRHGRQWVTTMTLQEP